MDEFFSRLGIVVTRIIIARVVTYVLESTLGTATAGGVTGGAKRLDVGLLIAVLSGLSGYATGNLVEKAEEIITVCEKRNERWVRV
ncbi:hypothetical protein [Acidianus sp. HS-5]|uniref:hypothetical protein n=1 Tax=Acidianus sp. HS-5 TaxID=2886040 RepID=UPI001F1AA592|nr:hypothetical protein [Acidianus sp. HS-5]BDC17408.1 hypothetical protein HS5_02980 [Acidianus sp. HS-5]